MLPELEALERRVAELLTIWRVPPGAPVAVSWNARLRTTAGRAFMEEGRIELNPSLLEAEPQEIPAVVVHEAAHVAVYRMFGPRVAPHGRQWRALMRLAGLPPEVTHDLPVRRSTRNSSRWQYLRICDACGDRRLGRSVRYGPCACGVEDRYLVLRAAAGPRGLAALRATSIDEARRRCRRLAKGAPGASDQPAASGPGAKQQIPAP